jgi:hypothetical protein
MHPINGMEFATNQHCQRHRSESLIPTLIAVSQKFRYQLTPADVPEHFHRLNSLSISEYDRRLVINWLQCLQKWAIEK